MALNKISQPASKLWSQSSEIGGIQNIRRVFVPLCFVPAALLVAGIVALTAPSTAADAAESLLACVQSLLSYLCGKDTVRSSRQKADVQDLDS